MLSVELPILAVRLITLLSGLSLVFVGFRYGYLASSRWDLPPRLQGVRYVSALVGGLGLWMALGAFRHAPTGEELPCLPLEEAQALAAERAVPLLIDFTADWCAACHELRARTLNSAAVLAEQHRFVCAEVDVTAETPEQTALMEVYAVQGLPRIAVIDAGGTFLPQASLSGLVSPDELLEAVDRAERGEDSGGSRFRQVLDGRGWIWAFFLVFLAGVGTSLTPCVYPLIPVTIGVFGAAGARSRLQGFALSLVYVAGIALTYSVLGVLAAMTGGLFGAALQSPWVIGFIASLFVALALSMLGLFELRLPGALQDRLTSVGGAGYAGAFGMGLVAGVIAAPCVGPVLSGVLLFIAESRDPVIGAALMVTFAVGMGVLFMVLGTFSSLLSRVPSSGPWMEVVKATFAIVFICVALYFIAPHLPVVRAPQLIFWELFMSPIAG